jgi:hypothetical protein
MYWIAHLEALVTSGYLADFKVRWSKQIHWTLWKVFVQSVCWKLTVPTVSDVSHTFLRLPEEALDFRQVVPHFLAP